MSTTRRDFLRVAAGAAVAAVVPALSASSGNASPLPDIPAYIWDTSEVTDQMIWYAIDDYLAAYGQNLHIVVHLPERVGDAIAPAGFATIPLTHGGYVTFVADPDESVTLRAHRL